jgi:hypothetical protein
MPLKDINYDIGITFLYSVGEDKAMNKKVVAVGASMALSLSAIAIIEAPSSIAAKPGQSCAQVGVCAIGDIGPGGGKVFYVATSPFTQIGAPCGSNCLYLEAAPTRKGKGSWTDTAAPWSGNAGTLIGNTGAATGYGYANSNAISDQSGAGTSGAASIAKAYRGPNRRTDWFLPSKDELNELYSQRLIVGGFKVGNYWSSTEAGNGDAYYQYFLDGQQPTALKYDATLYVRPIRAF